MRQKIRTWLIAHTARTLTTIPDGIRGEFSKVTEEYLELQDAINQKNRKLTFIEACDLVDVTLAFEWQQFRVPTFVVLALVYFRRLYKPVRDKLYFSVGFLKEHWNDTEKQFETRITD